MDPVLEVENLGITYRRGKGPAVPFIQGLDLVLSAPAEIFCLVGESGSGNTLTVLALFDALPPGFERFSGRIRLCGEDITGSAKGRDRMAYVFQDPGAALNPVFTVGRQLAGVARSRGFAGRAPLLDALKAVSLPYPEERLMSYPHELSGGMQQRVLIAMALLSRPRLMVADEPTTSLDLTVQDRILRLLKESRGAGTALLLITHDFGVVAEMAARVGVMYAGRLVETAPVRDLFNHPLHPYTRLLLEARPSRGMKPIPGEAPGLTRPPGGCPFHPRCPDVLPVCHTVFPAEFSPDGRTVFCHLYPSTGKAIDAGLG